MRFSISFLFALSVVFSTFSSPTFATEKGANKVFTIGMISTKPKKRIKSATPLADYIVERLPEYSESNVLVSSSVDEIAGLLESGEVSMVTVTPYAALLIEEKSNAKVSALRWKQGVESYHSVIFARKDSNINDVKDLVGRTIIFEKDSSTSAFFAPSVYLLKQGFELQKLHSIKDKPDPDKIGYLFINEHLQQSNEVNMSIWVFHKRLDAAAFSDLDWGEPKTTPVKAKEKLHIIAETPSIPRGTVLFSPTLSAQSQQVLLNILQQAEQNEEGLAAMQRFQKTSRFTPIPAHLETFLEQAREQLIANPTLFK